MRQVCIRHVAPYLLLGTVISAFSENVRSDSIFVVVEVKSVVKHYSTASSHYLALKVLHSNCSTVKVQEVIYAIEKLSIDVRPATKAWR